MSERPANKTAAHPDLSLEPSELTERFLVSVALALGAKKVPVWSLAEEELAQAASESVPEDFVSSVRRLISLGQDPLGNIFCQLRGPAERRAHGAIYTPAEIVSSMLAWAETRPAPSRIVDPGLGSGRFLVEAGRRFPKASLFGVEIDPLASLLARAHVVTAGLERQSQILRSDYRAFELPTIRGKSLYIGNPPYVRHHLLAPEWKAWLTEHAKTFEIRASQLAGLHVHFFLATALKSQPGDFGTFITSAEWLDVNYGNLVRELLLNHLGGQSITVIEPEVLPFEDTATTAAITCFEVGSKPKSVRVRRVKRLVDLGDLRGGRAVRRERLEAAARWSFITHNVAKPPEGYVELGELCRVHRGQVTGHNKFWISGPHAEGLPESVKIPTVTKARELFQAGRILADDSELRCVIDLPTDLDVFDRAEREAVEKFLSKARSLGVPEGYVASSRKVWWSVGLREPAPVLTTYMARRPPAFVHNLAKARHINIAHGLYPREPLTKTILRRLVTYLSESTQLRYGRTYAGGLTKFEPREVERLFVPGMQLLSRLTA